MTSSTDPTIIRLLQRERNLAEVLGALARYEQEKGSLKPKIEAMRIETEARLIEIQMELVRLGHSK